jgi:hypothetical protein
MRPHRARSCLPGALGLSVILGSLVLLPPLLRGLALVTRRAPLSIRLATISVAREPLRPAAVMTLLAFSVAAVVFGQVYSATLRQGAADQAAFAVGLDVRVQTLAAEGRFGTYVLPLLRNGQVGADVAVRPMVRILSESATRRTFILAGIDATAIGDLKGWRSDFSSADPATLGAAIHLDGEWRMAGQPLPDGARDVSIDVQYSGDPIKLAAVVEQADGGVRYLPFGELVSRSPVDDGEAVRRPGARRPAARRAEGLARPGNLRHERWSGGRRRAGAGSPPGGRRDDLWPRRPHRSGDARPPRRLRFGEPGDPAARSNGRPRAAGARQPRPGG